tara:strand:- start:13161 stop:14132 length:972 start_codon:yes stop_codon:yes gene_type:complete
MTRYERLPEPSETIYHPDDEIALRQLFATLWQGKWIIVATTILFAIAGVFYALSKPNIYQANVLLAPAQNEGNSGGISGQLGGLASLAGINIGGGGSNKTVLAKEVLKSSAFLTDFIRRHNLSVPLMATESWNMKSHSWVVDPEIYSVETSEWQQDDEGESLKPTDWDMVKKIRDGHLSLSEDKETGMLTIKLKSLSPPVAKEWADLLVKDINEHMREQDVQEAEARIAYLEEKLNETNIAGMQQVFYQLIESETRTVMLANAQNEYVFKTVDPAVVPQEKSEPKRALIAILAVMLGGMLGVFIVFIRAYIRSGKQDTTAEKE